MMKRLAGFLLAAALSGCGAHANFVKVDQVPLGRVVVYRNGVAFYERRATVEGGVLTVSVPRERVDDFLKSLTVVDANTNQPLPVAIPRQQSEWGNNLVMSLQLPTQKTADVVLTYVTESPAWKPSYRVAVKNTGKVLIEGWAIVDNTSGEDWNDVVIGVGSSSALSFRYDLWSVRNVQREELATSERFAVAPPTGGSLYGGAAPPASTGDGSKEVISELTDDEIRRPAGHPGAASPSVVQESRSADDAEYLTQSAGESAGETITITGRAPLIDQGSTKTAMVISSDYARNVPSGVLQSLPSAPSPPPPLPQPTPAAPPLDPRLAAGDRKMRQLAESVARSGKSVVVEVYTDKADAEANRLAADRGNLVRNQLIDNGVAPAQIQVTNKVDPAQAGRVRMLAQAAPPALDAKARARAIQGDAQPVGESHFASALPMNVLRNSSALVSIVRHEADGEVVYLYDAESERGNADFAFRAVRFKNPTDSTLETGPVTVYGDKRFIGEGLTEPIPPRASAVVPYALDRQIVVERTDDEIDKISRLHSLSRGTLSAQVQHTRKKQLKITNRLNQPAKVFVRHTVHKGWTLTEAPPAFERIGEAHLFEIHLAPLAVQEVTIAEVTPIERTLDLSADVTLEMMKVWVETPEGSPELKDQLRKLLGVHRSLVDLASEQDSMRRRLGDYRVRSNELHRQIVTLQAVRTGGDLLAHLRQKMKEVSSSVQKTTIQIVDQEQKMMLARVQFQDLLSELVLPDASAPATAAKSLSTTRR